MVQAFNPSAQEAGLYSEIDISSGFVFPHICSYYMEMQFEFYVLSLYLSCTFDKFTFFLEMCPFRVPLVYFEYFCVKSSSIVWPSQYSFNGQIWTTPLLSFVHVQCSPPCLIIRYNFLNSSIIFLVGKSLKWMCQRKQYLSCIH